jgi:DNA topoisomerase-1
MRTKHVDIHGSKISFSFLGKSRVHHSVNLTDKRIARIVKQCSDLPGYDLFQYVDDDGAAHSIDSQSVNDYLREITGEHFTAKDFRTWAGSVLCCDLLSGFEPAASVTQAKKNVVQAIAQVAAQLGNTPSVCRKCYVHPAVLERYLGNISTDEAKGELEREIKHERKAIAAHAAALRREEKALLNLLQQKKLLHKAA